MSKVDYILDVPFITKDEPKITSKQKRFIEHLLSEIEAINIPYQTIDSFGMWQASSFIDRLIDIKDGFGVKE